MPAEDLPPDAPAPLVRIAGLRHRYTKEEVLAGIDLELGPGLVFGYIGPNGAGKSTTVKILTGLLGGFSGEASVCGHDVRRDPLAVKSRIGYVPENAVLYEQLTVEEFLELVGRLHRIAPEVRSPRIEGILEGFELDGRLGSRIASLSKGMRQKVLLTAALLHDPPLLFLDEPLTGLDVDAARLVKELIRGLADRGRTIFYCSHNMDVVERVCDRIAIIAGGRIVADGTFDELSRAGERGTLENVFAEITRGEEAARDVGRRVETILGTLGPHSTANPRGAADPGQAGDPGAPGVEPE